MHCLHVLSLRQVLSLHGDKTCRKVHSLHVLSLLPQQHYNLSFPSLVVSVCARARAYMTTNTHHEALAQELHTWWQKLAPIITEFRENSNSLWAASLGVPRLSQFSGNEPVPSTGNSYNKVHDLISKTNQAIMLSCAKCWRNLANKGRLICRAHYNYLMWYTTAFHITQRTHTHTLCCRTTWHMTRVSAVNTGRPQKP